MSPLDKIKKFQPLKGAMVALESAQGPLAKVKAGKQLITEMQKLGIYTSNADSVPTEDGTSKPQERTSRLSSLDVFDRQSIELPVKTSERQKANDAAIALIDRVINEGLARDDLTDDEIETLARYTGNGGGIKNKEGLVGSDYEYYTPIEVAAGMWDFARELGFSGGKVLDPSAGTGIFAATSPDDALVSSVELDETSGTIGAILNDNERNDTVVSSFEAQAKDMPDDSVDMVMTNVPFGSKAARGDNWKHDKAYQSESLENYFILRSLDKLKPGGLAVFITPTRVVSGKKAKQEKLRRLTSLKAEFLGAYRLPNKVFEKTGADVITDVIAYRKHSKEGAEAINELYEAGDTDALINANVLWDDYISGKYFQLQKNSGLILGTMETTINRFGQEVDYISSPKSVPDIAKMLRKFGGSRIDWDAINAAEPTAIEYNNGDTLFQKGRQLEYQDGIWREIEVEVTDTALEMHQLLAKVGSAIDIINNGVTWEQMQQLGDYCKLTGQFDLIPSSVYQLMEDAQSGGSRRGGNYQVDWQCVTVAKAINDSILKHGYDYNYVENEPILTKAMKSAFLDGKNSKLKGEPARAHKLVALHYEKGKYSAAWRGEIETNIADTEGAQSYSNKLARIQYENKSLKLTIEQLKEIRPDVDPMQDDDWFIVDGGKKVIPSDDFLVGNLASRLRDIDNQIAASTNDELTAKLVRQRLIAVNSVKRIDFSRMEFDLRSPLIDAETKVKFLKEFVHKDAVVVYDEYNQGTPDIQAATGDSHPELNKLYNRIGDWLAKGTVTLGGVKTKTMTERQALEWLSAEIRKANDKFNNWMHANEKLINKIDAKANKPENLYFVQNSDDSPIDIAGMNPKLNLHGYQRAFVRQQGRMFGGINGMGVGLGKTFSALSSVQHVQNIGAKKKTLFVVPNSVLSNWRKEAQFAYQNTDDCIYIGLRQTKDSFRVKSSLYDEDLLKALDGKYRKIFMTYEAFKRIRLKDETVEGYAQYLRETDAAYSRKELKGKDEKSKGLVEELINTISIKSNAPYLEDMSVDSIVIDEAHAFKNSITAPNTDSRVKYLSLAKTSQRGEDAQAKLWYIRSRTPNKDGVQLLTATPITNSPLEIYSMLSLAGGREAANSMAGGVHGADQFVQVMCEIQEELMPTIDGKESSQNVFTGIRNVQILRNAINSTTTILDAQDVGMSVVIPERDENFTQTVLDNAARADLEVFQVAYSMAKDIINDEGTAKLPPDDPNSAHNPNSPFNQIQAMFGEPTELIAHPFNLITKMDITIVDKEFNRLASFYDFAEDQRDIAEKVIKTMNGKSIIDTPSRISAYTDRDNVTPVYVTKDGEKKLKHYKVAINARFIQDAGRERILIDTVNSKIQTTFEAIAEKAGLNLKVTASAKISALLDNMKAELSNPRGVNPDGTNSKIVKQIIFCDHLFMHNKIKRLIAERTKIPASKIVIITGQTNNEPDQMIDIQNGFNAMGDENEYQVVIANKKAEVGINLQIGTQAIHHLTTGWSPDSLEQRNGRGARQGNKTDKVTIYYYDAEGTFDQFKRTMIDKKDEWITSVLSDDDKSTVAVSGGITRQEQEALIEIARDPGAAQKYLAEKDAKEAQARKEAAIRRQKTNLELIVAQKKQLRGLEPIKFYNDDVIDAITIIRENLKNLKNYHSETRKEKTRELDLKKYNAARAVALEKLTTALESVHFVKSEGHGSNEQLSDAVGVKEGITPESLYEWIELNASDRFKPGDKDYSWVRRFSNQLAPSSFGFDVVVKNDSEYQAAYDETKKLAENLIEQSSRTIDRIANDVGGLPVGAGAKIANGEAVYDKGVYLEAGAFVEGDFTSPRIVDKKFNISNIALEGYAVGAVDSWSLSEGAKIIFPGDDEYLTYVKRAAKVEDDLLLASKLRTALYSDTAPIVAEYRDKSIIAKWPVRPLLLMDHDELKGGSFPYVMPVKHLKSGTDFSKALLKAYEKDGIKIDMEDGNGKFWIEEGSKVTVVPGNYFARRRPATTAADIRNFAIANGVKLSTDDEFLLMGNLFEYFTKDDTEHNLPERIDKLVEKLLETDDFSELPADLRKIYNDVYHDDRYLPELGDAFIDHFLYSMFSGTTSSGKTMSGFIRERIDKTRGAATLTNANIVAIGGNTKEWYPKLKIFAIRNDGYVKGRKKAVWLRDREVWLVRYGAYEALIKNYPLAAGELTVRKEV